MICPTCGFEQPDGGTGCLRCGIVFARYRPSPSDVPAPPDGPIEPGPPPFAAAPAATLYGGPLPPVTPPPPFAPGLLSGYRFEMGAVFAETFRTYFANFLPFVVLSLVIYSPILVWTLLTMREVTSRPHPLQTGVVALLGVVCGPLTTAAVTFGVFQQMRGRDTSLGECLQVGLANLLPVLGVALLQGVVIGLGLTFCVIPGL